MTTKQTPGPWQSIHLHGKHYCVAEQKSGVGLLYNEANARLMAAAPELLAALKKSERHIAQLCEMVNDLAIKQGLGRKVHPEDWTEPAREAIANAA
jgi:hypothetical protein